jgi:hypothetical protein
MYHTSDEFQDKIKQPSRSLTAKVDIRGNEYGDANVVEMVLDETVNPGDSFTLGAAPSAKLDLTVIDVDDVIFEGAAVKPYVGLEGEGALSFDGVGDYVEVDNSPFINLTLNFTLECWVSTSKDGYLMFKGTSSSDRQYAIYNYPSANSISFYHNREGASGYVRIDWLGEQLTDNKWTHIAITVNVDRAELFKNGISLGERTMTGKIVTTEGNLFIGKRPGGGLLTGNIFDVRIWNTVRTAKEIVDNMNTKLTGNEPGLVGYWPLNEGSGTIAHDLSGNGNHGEIHGATWVDPTEYVPLGIFTVDSLTKAKNKTRLTCFDNMVKLEKPYFSELTYPAKLSAVAQEIADKAGVTLATTLPDTRVPELDGYTLREAIGFVASFMGGFARFNRDGALEIASYTATDTAIIPDNYVTFETGEKPFSIGRLTCYVGPGEENEEGEGGEGNGGEGGDREPIILTAGDTGNEISFENPLMTQDQLDTIYASLSQLSYMPYKLRWQGNPALMAGDIITITDTENNTFETLIMDQQLRYTGGLTATAEAKGKTEQAQEFQTAGPVTRKMERYTTDLANVKVLLADKANVGDLSAVDAKIENLVVDTAQIADGAITNAKIKNAEITGAKIKSGEIDTAHIKTGAITTALIEEGAIETAQIADGSITDAKIVGLTANKITAGKIDAAEIEVVNLKAANITVGTINGEQISDGAIGPGHIVTGAITNAKIAPGAITGDKIQAGSIKEAAMNWTMHLLF